MHFKLHFYNDIFLFFILDNYLTFTLTSNCHASEKIRAQTRSPSKMQTKAIPKPDLQTRIYIVHEIHTLHTFTVCVLIFIMII